MSLSLAVGEDKTGLVCKGFGAGGGGVEAGAPSVSAELVVEVAISVDTSGDCGGGVGWIVTVG